MGTITKPVTLADGTVPTAANFNDNFDTIITEINGSLDNSNIDASAGIEATKISGTASTLGAAETFTGAKTFKKTIQTINTATDGATVTFDLSLGNIQAVTLGGNRTLAVSNVSVGQIFIVRLVQDGTGSRTVTWFSTIAWDGGAAPILSTTASEIDTFAFICTSSGNYDGYVVGQGLS